MPEQEEPNVRKWPKAITTALKAAVSGIFQAVTRWLLDNLV